MLHLCFGNYFTYVKSISISIISIISDQYHIPLVLTEIAYVYPIYAHRGGCTLKGYQHIFLSLKELVLLVI